MIFTFQHSTGAIELACLCIAIFLQHCPHGPSGSGPGRHYVKVSIPSWLHSLKLGRLPRACFFGNECMRLFPLPPLFEPIQLLSLVSSWSFLGQPMLVTANGLVSPIEQNVSLHE